MAIKRKIITLLLGLCMSMSMTNTAIASPVVVPSQIEICEHIKVKQYVKKRYTHRYGHKRKSLKFKTISRCERKPINIVFNVNPEYASRNMTHSMLRSISAEAIAQTTHYALLTQRIYAIQSQLRNKILFTNKGLSKPIFLSQYVTVHL